MLDLYERIRRSNITLRGDLEFMNESQFFLDDPLGHFEQLVSTGPYAGTLEAFATGVKLRTAYEALLDHAVTQHRISLWASDSKRVIDTAKYFSSGFFGLDWESIANLKVIPETRDRGGDTLTPGRTCLHYVDNTDDHGHDLGSRKLLEWRSVYLPPIIERLALQNPGLLFTETEVYSMQELCGFESIAQGSSPWCAVFTQQEWESFEYARDLLQFYKSGPGNPYGATMGFLWLNATTQLLRQGSSEGTLFLSFVHDGDIIPLIATLNLLPQTHPALLPTTHVPANRTWRISDVVPMGGRLIFERLACPVPQECWDNGPMYPNHVYCAPPREDVFVRVNVNDAIVELPSCASGPGEARSCRVRRRVGKGRVQASIDELLDRENASLLVPRKGDLPKVPGKHGLGKQVVFSSVVDGKFGMNKDIVMTVIDSFQLHS
nr:3-phytase b [Quercus suber]